MRAPTAARFLIDAEWSILQSVFDDTLPFRYRILITDALGGGNRPFTIPTSALSVLTIPAAAESAFNGFVMSKLGGAGKVISDVANYVGITGAASTISQWAGTVNLGYLVSVGPTHYPNMASSAPNLLVHELAHVWQGSNSYSSMSYVNNSIMEQCRAIGTSSSHGGAYAYTPGQNWHTYNAEEQASIIEDWYASGMPQSGDLWPYIRDYVRRGRA